MNKINLTFPHVCNIYRTIEFHFINILPERIKSKEIFSFQSKIFSSERFSVSIPKNCYYWHDFVIRSLYILWDVNTFVLAINLIWDFMTESFPWVLKFATSHLRFDLQLDITFLIQPLLPQCGGVVGAVHLVCIV